MAGIVSASAGPAADSRRIDQSLDDLRREAGQVVERLSTIESALRIVRGAADDLLAA